MTRLPAAVYILGSAVAFGLGQSLFLTHLGPVLGVAVPAAVGLIGAFLAIPELRRVGRKHWVLVIGLVCLLISAAVHPATERWGLFIAGFILVVVDLSIRGSWSEPAPDVEAIWQLVGAAVLFAALGMSVGVAARQAFDSTTDQRLERLEDYVTVLTACAGSDAGQAGHAGLVDLRRHITRREADCIARLSPLTVRDRQLKGELGIN